MPFMNWKDILVVGTLLLFVHRHFLKTSAQAQLSKEPVPIPEKIPYTVRYITIKSDALCRKCNRLRELVPLRTCVNGPTS